MENLFYLVLLLALGKISRYIKAFPENTAAVLNQFAIFISLPATILLKLNGLEVSPQLLMLAVVPWGLVICSIFSAVALGKWLGWEKRLTGAVMLCTGLGNTSFFGFPAVSVFLGESFLGYAVIYDQLGTFLALVTFGTVVVSYYGTAGEGKQDRILMRILKFPPFGAMVLGLVLMKTQYPPLVLNILQGLSATLIPLVTFSVGSVLVFRQPVKNMLPISIIMGLKMIVWPMLGFMLLLFLQVKGPVFKVSVVEAGMPSMVMAGVIAAAGNLRTDVANAAIGYGILFALVTLPILSFLVTSIQW